MNQTIMGCAVARSCFILLHSVCRKTRGCVRRDFHVFVIINLFRLN